MVLVLYDGAVLMDIAGPLQVLNGAAGYRVRLASPHGRPVRTDVGVPMGVDLALSQLRSPVDTVLVAGFPTRKGHRPPDDVTEHVRRLAAQARRVASVCTGALVLAEAGLLAGRRATTHWRACSALARYPDVTVQPDAICVRDGPVFTSAGVTAGIDLALALVAEDMGVERARTVAKHLVVFLQRPGGQAQFDLPSGPEPRDPVVRQVLKAAAADPAGDHSLAAMAARVAVSERHLTRLFQRDLGVSPVRQIEQLRVHAAQRRLERGNGGLAAVAGACGFGSTDTMRRAFVRVAGVTPTAYRARFRAPVPGRQATVPRAAGRPR
ncbi:DJ-1/PfpI family protein [Asanoa sp. WMMD1127]|uniref:GlxA family transcriptional regulator n=1 Tax=Asanoa sp. WMMD1127 TaxID=3016107 RepID=UPI0024164133|nr:DJ-1/PfpI family protein [Asanoa sp. WMMD1127]MDG4825082.1 DJ-1/PfpI family protein [Asanoa sp. WMMD1127]